jgi:hypothetical protein
MGVPAVFGVLAMMAGGTGAVVAVARRRRKKAAPVIPPMDLGAMAPEPEPVAAPGPGGSPLAGVGDIAKGLLNGGVLGTIGAGLKVADMQGKLIEALGGTEGQADTARVFGPIATLPILADMGTEKLLDAIGLKNKDIQDKVGQAVGAGVVGGALVPGALVVGGADLLLGAISKDAQKVVHDVFRPFDPTNPNALVGKGVAAVADVVEGGVGGVVKAGGAIVKGIGKALKGVFGGEPQPPPIPDNLNAVKLWEAATKAGFTPEAKVDGDWLNGVHRNTNTAFPPAALAMRQDMSAAALPGYFVRWNSQNGRRMIRGVHAQWKHVVELEGPPLDPAKHGFPTMLWIEAPKAEEFSVLAHTDMNWTSGVLVAQAADGFTPASVAFPYDMSTVATPGRTAMWMDGVSRAVIGTHPEYPNVVLLEGEPVDPVARGFPETVQFTGRTSDTFQVADVNDENWLHGILKIAPPPGFSAGAVSFQRPMDLFVRKGQVAEWPNGGRRTVVGVHPTFKNVVLMDGGPLPLEGHGYPAAVKFTEDVAANWAEINRRAREAAEAQAMGVWAKVQAAARAVAKP